MLNSLPHLKLLNNLKKVHCIYFDWYLDPRAGGPTGYLANLRSGVQLNQSDFKERIFFACRPRPKNIAIFPKSNLSKITIAQQLQDLRGIKEIRNSFLNEGVLSHALLPLISTIHCHSVADVIKVSNTFQKLRNTLTDLPKIILTAHNPEPLGSEHFENKMSQGYDYDIAKQVKEEWLKIEELGFMLADILIFPSPEAMDPARHFLNNFNFIEKSKDIRFLKTGCMPIAEGPGRASILEQYNIPPDAKVIGFLGRHTYIKGYDILKEACTNLLEKHKNLYVLIAGNGVIPPLQHPRWIECGRVDQKIFWKLLTSLFSLTGQHTMILFL